MTAVITVIMPSRGVCLRNCTVSCVYSLRDLSKIRNYLTFYSFTALFNEFWQLSRDYKPVIERHS